jgi:hypothetical protein
VGAARIRPALWLNEPMPMIADPEVADRIDVVAVDLSGDWSRWRALPGTVIGSWSGDRVREVLGLVAALPEDEQMRCFVPRYGIRVLAGPSVLAEAAFCFRCHNGLIFPLAGASPQRFTFDPDSRPARELLALLGS